MSSDLSLPEQVSTSPMRLMELALEHGAGIDIMERLAKLQSDMLNQQAEQDFNEAMNRCQLAMGRISANMENPQTRSRYADYAQIDRAIRPIYTKEGFSLSFGDADSALAESVTILCYVSRGRYTRIYRKVMPIVTKGPKGNDVMTAIHATGAADAYAKRYLIKDIFNLAIGEDDKDGNGIGNEEAASLVTDILHAETDDEYKSAVQKAKRTALEVRDYKALRLIDEAIDRRKKVTHA